MSCFISILYCISKIDLEQEQHCDSCYRNQTVRHQYLLSCDPSGNIRKNNYNTTPRNNCYFGTGCSDYLFIYVTVPISEQFRYFFPISTLIPLTPLDYFLWCHMKSLINKTPVESEEDLLEWVMTAADVELPGTGDRVYQNMVRRYSVCVEVAGRHMKPFL